MEKTCLYCGASFDGSPQARYCSDAHRQAARRQGREVGQNPVDENSVTEKSVRATQKALGVQAPKRRDLDANGRPNTLRGLMAAARAGELVLNDREEQLIRNHYGYATSERRTLLQRDAAAQKMKESFALPAPGSTVVRHDADGVPVAEPVGPAGLSLVAFPNQTEGDLTPSPEALAKLG